MDDVDFSITLRNNNDDEIVFTGTASVTHSPADRSVGIMCDDYHVDEISLSDEDGNDVSLSSLSSYNRECVEKAAQDAVDKRR